MGKPTDISTEEEINLGNSMNSWLQLLYFLFVRYCFKKNFKFF